MRPILRALLLRTVLLASVSPAWADETVMDRLGQALTFSALQKNVRGKISGTMDLEVFGVDQPSPGLVFTEGQSLLNPRLSLFLDARWGALVYGFVQVRADRGFDPNSDTPRFRLDEYAIRIAAGPEKYAVLELGKFSNVIGTWVKRHATWDNPFITAPLPYENVTGVSDLAAPASPNSFGPPEHDEKYEFNPILWGPGYSTGAKIAGTGKHFDYALEVKNSSPASRPEAWTLSHQRFDAPAFNGRVGFRPNLLWSFGLSASDSAYLLPKAGPTLPVGRSRRDFRQRLWGQDVSFAWHHLQVWAELFQSSFDVPQVGVVRTRAGYVEAKFKISPEVYTALRINRQSFSPFHRATGRPRWGENLSRVDFVTGLRLTPFALLKLQASSEQPEQSADRLNFCGQFSVRF